jgi:hypothetical protein
VYLGPAAEKFLERQCKMLKTEPAKLEGTHMEQLAWLTKNAATLVMDEAKATEFSKKLAAVR